MKGRVFTNSNFQSSGQINEKQNENNESNHININLNQQTMNNENPSQNEFSREEMKKVIRLKIRMSLPINSIIKISITT